MGVLECGSVIVLCFLKYHTTYSLELLLSNCISVPKVKSH